MQVWETSTSHSLSTSSNHDRRQSISAVGCECERPCANRWGAKMPLKLMAFPRRSI